MTKCYLDTREVLAEQMPILNANLSYTNQVLGGIFLALTVCTGLLTFHVLTANDSRKKY